METVIINDVGPRDGLQNDPATVSVEDRVALINALVDAGVPAVEVVSFVSPKAVPKMAGAARVVAALDLNQADFSALVPNHKGYELARDAGVRSVAVVLSATDTMNEKNINMDLETTVRVCEEIMNRAGEDGIRPRAYISVAVECPFEGLVPESRIEDLATRMFNAGALEVIIADTIGAANPAQVKSLFSRLVAVLEHKNCLHTFTIPGRLRLQMSGRRWSVGFASSIRVSAGWGVARSHRVRREISQRKTSRP